MNLLTFTSTKGDLMSDAARLAAFKNMRESALQECARLDAEIKKLQDVRAEQVKHLRHLEDEIKKLEGQA